MSGYMMVDWLFLQTLKIRWWNLSPLIELFKSRHEDDIDATLRSFERISHIYGIYKEGGYSRGI
ncbi:MAG: hypothetical protein ACLR5T_06680 [Veillonella sp.]